MKENIYVYIAEIEEITNNGKSKVTFKDTFSHAGEIKVGVPITGKLAGYFKMTRKTANAVYVAKKVDKVKLLGQTVY